MIPHNLREFLSDNYDKEYNGAIGVLASLRPDGTPNASPKHFRIRDENHLEFTDVFSTTLSDVLQNHPDVTVVFFDREAVIGFRIKGHAILETFGPLFQQAATQIENLGFKPKAVVNIEIEEIQALSYGPNTGKRVG